jgi:hypothetical protein
MYLIPKDNLRSGRFLEFFFAVVRDYILYRVVGVSSLLLLGCGKRVWFNLGLFFSLRHCSMGGTGGSRSAWAALYLRVCIFGAGQGRERVTRCVIDLEWLVFIEHGAVRAYDQFFLSGCQELRSDLFWLQGLFVCWLLIPWRSGHGSHQGAMPC